MYRLLIVDDEEIIRKGIAAKLKYNNFEAAEILEAGDGKQAIEIINEKCPDIVITDVRMPFMDGIELIRQARQTHPDIRFIIISGYAEFSYAEQAINMGVDGYLLKPVSNDDFVKSVSRVFDSLEDEKRNKNESDEKHVLEKYCDTLSVEQRLNTILHSVKKFVEKGIASDFCMMPKSKEQCNKYALAIVNIDGKSYYQSEFKYEDLDLLKFGIMNIFNEIDTECTKYVCNNLKDMNQILVLFTHNSKVVIRTAVDKFSIEAFGKIKKYLNVSITMGLSGIEEVVSVELYRQAKEAFNQRIIHGENKIFRFQDIPVNNNFVIPHNEIKLLQKCIERYDVGNIIAVLNSIFSEKNMKGMSASYIRFVWLEITNMLIKVCNDLNLDVTNTLNTFFLSEEVLDKFDRMNEIVDYLYTTIIDVFKLENITDMNSRNRIKMAVQYMEQHFQEDITVNELAYKFAMNPNYFSTIFKKETGQSVINYLTDIRINNACSLLTQTQASVVDIARSIGYEDPQYFYRVFRKSTGKTPLEYRKGK